MKNISFLFTLLTFMLISNETFSQSLILNDGTSEIALDIYTIDDDGSFIFDPSNSSPYNRSINSNTGSDNSCEQERERSPDWHVMCGPTTIATLDGGSVRTTCENTSTVFCAKVLKSSLGL